MSKVVTPEEYRKEKTKIVETSSGFKWKIKKMSPEVGGQLLKIFGATGKTKEFQVEQLDDLANLLLPTCVEEPKITQTSTKGALMLHEINFGDQIELVFDILDFSGITGATAKARELFRKASTKRTRKAD